MIKKAYGQKLNESQIVKLLRLMTTVKSLVK